MKFWKSFLEILLSALLLVQLSLGHLFPVSGAEISAISPTVSIGNGFMVALNAEGEAYAWGNNDAGNLGNGTTEDTKEAVKVTMPDGVTFTDIDAGATTLSH